MTGIYAAFSLVFVFEGLFVALGPESGETGEYLRGTSG